MKEMFAFSGWTFIGSSSAILRDQGSNILLNLYAGPIVNAARGIAEQVNGAVNSFASNFMTAVNPQITKSYAANEKEYMLDLIYKSAKFSLFLLLFFIFANYDRNIIFTNYLVKNSSRTHCMVCQINPFFMHYATLLLDH